jgi:hypothetical protein
MLSAVNMINIKEIFQCVHPTREQFTEELKEQRKVLVKRVTKAATISTLATIQVEESQSNGNVAARLDDAIYSSSTSTNVQSRQFSSVINAQELEDEKMAGEAFDEVMIK